MRTIRTTTMALLLATLACAPISARTGANTMMHATGTFEIRMTPEAQTSASETGVPTSRMGLSKLFSGGLQGTATGTMIAAGEPKTGSAASYVAIDHFSGTLAGRRGGFVLVHRGTMTRDGVSDLKVIVAPDSATGELTGLTGELSIDVREGKHLYDLTYALPSR